MKRVLLVDIGATNTRLALGWEENGHPIISDLILYKTPQNADSLMERIINYANKKKDITLASISSIGPLDLERGWILETPNSLCGL